MPLYEYRCESCGGEFERLSRSGAGREAPACPECGGDRVARKFSTFGTRTATADAPTTASGGGCGCSPGGCGCRMN